MIEPNLGVFIIETTHCMFRGSEKIQRKGSMNDRAKSRCFYNRDNLLKKASKKAIPFCTNEKTILKALTTLQALTIFLVNLSNFSAKDFVL